MTRGRLPQFRDHLGAEWWLGSQRCRSCKDGRTYSAVYNVTGLRELAWRLVRWQRRARRRAA